MHRSGTSALTRVLNFLGCDLPKTLIHSTSGNLKGHWESKGILELNEEILASSGSSWTDWTPFNSAWDASPNVQNFLAKAGDILDTEFEDSDLFVIKDPRICRILPFWIKATTRFNAKPIIISPLRNPIDVGASLFHRDGIHPTVGYLLWLRHVLDCEAKSRDYARCWLRYEDLLSDPEITINAMVSNLNVVWPNYGLESSQGQISDFLSSNLRHHRTRTVEPCTNSTLSDWIKSTFEILNRWCKGDYSQKDIMQLERIRSSFNSATSIFNPALAANNQTMAAYIEERMNNLTHIKELEQTAKERNEWIATLEAGHARRVQELEKTTKGLELQISKIHQSKIWRYTAPLRASSYHRLWSLLRQQRNNARFTKWIINTYHFQEKIYRSRYTREALNFSFLLVHRLPILLPSARKFSRMLPFADRSRLARYYRDWNARFNRSAEETAGPSAENLDIRHDSINWNMLRPFALRGQLTTGWYGNRELTSNETFQAHNRPPQNILELNEKAYLAGSSLINSRYLQDATNLEDLKFPYLRYAPLKSLQNHVAQTHGQETSAKIRDCAEFSIITPFRRHLEFFKNTAASINLLASNYDDTNLEWIIVNDDDHIRNPEILDNIPENIREVTTVLASDGEGGIVNSLNAGIKNARHQWLLFLDCDDEIEENALSVLMHYQKKFPRCRYISSSITDIDETGSILRYRGNEFPLERLFDLGMTAGHLKAIRRDLFSDLGCFDNSFAGCQDYEFALRTTMHEPILKIPEALYRYRWHKDTQSVSRHHRQLVTTSRLQREYFRRFLFEKSVPGGVACPNRSLSPIYGKSPYSLHGGVIIRTQNKRREYLIEAINSVLQQRPRLTPIVVVHGSEGELSSVKNLLKQYTEVVFLFASEDSKPNRRLGYPANVALDYISDLKNQYDFFTFLDDDDILYPSFSPKMREALVWSGADIVYAMSNKRWPWKAPEPGPVPLPASCLILENFITCNSYCLTSDFLRKHSIRFDEHMLYLDDWDFLLSLWKHDAHFHFLSETVSEFRITNDGNTVRKRFPDMYEAAVKRMQKKARKAALLKDTGLANFQKEMLEFNWPDTVVDRINLGAIDTVYNMWQEIEREKKRET